jgi:retron-type reverse transcriptase
MIKITMNQNYFEIDNTFWLQENGTPMGSPVSSILAKIYLQELEVKFYPELIQKRHIQYIARYVDDEFVVYDGVNTTAEEILNDHNSMHPNMRYIIEIEHNDYISFLHLNLPT